MKNTKRCKFCGKRVSAEAYSTYYLIFICDKCKRYDKLHIGKSSMGWKFLFQGHKEDINIMSRAEWIEFLSHNNYKIFNEYGSEITMEKFLKLVDDKQTEKSNSIGTYQDSNNYEFCDNDFS